jgi:hypothetical protein
MAVLGASRAFKDWQVANGIADSHDDEKDNAADNTPIADKLKLDETLEDLTEAELKHLEEEDPLSLIDSLNTRVGTPLAPGISNSESCYLLFCRRVRFRGSLIPISSLSSFKSSVSKITFPIDSSRLTKLTNNLSSTSSFELESSTLPLRLHHPILSNYREFEQNIRT